MAVLFPLLEMVGGRIVDCFVFAKIIAAIQDQTDDVVDVLFVKFSLKLLPDDVVRRSNHVAQRANFGKVVAESGECLNVSHVL